MDESQLPIEFENARELLMAGEITRAHQIFATIAEHDLDYPGIRHALAASLPNSFLVRFSGQVDRHSAPIVKETLTRLLDHFKLISLLIIDLSDNTHLPSQAVEVLAELQKRDGLTLKLIEIPPKPRQIISALKMDHLLWDDLSCPVCGPDQPCIIKFGERERYPVSLNAVSKR